MMMIQARSFLVRSRAVATVPILRRHLVSGPTPCIINEPSLVAEIRHANARYEGRILIRRMDDTVGWGLEALRNYQRGEVVMQAKAVEIWKHPNSHTIQTDWDRHVRMDLPARFVNHRCNSANLGVQDNDFGAYDFVALRKIAKGEQLTWDYEDAEYDMENPFHCKCDDIHCREVVKGWKYSTDDKDMEYLPLYRENELEEQTS